MIVNLSKHYNPVGFRLISEQTLNCLLKLKKNSLKEILLMSFFM